MDKKGVKSVVGWILIALATLVLVLAQLISAMPARATPLIQSSSDLIVTLSYPESLIKTGSKYVSFGKNVSQVWTFTKQGEASYVIDGNETVVLAPSLSFGIVSTTLFRNFTESGKISHVMQSYEVKVAGQVKVYIEAYFDFTRKDSYGYNSFVKISYIGSQSFADTVSFAIPFGQYAKKLDKGGKRALFGLSGFDWSDAVGIMATFDNTSKKLYFTVARNFNIDPTTVTTVNVGQASLNVHYQRKAFRDSVASSNKYHIFPVNASIVRHFYSSDGTSWTADSNALTLSQNDAGDFSITTDGTLAYLVWVNSAANNAVNMKRGTIASDGTISWGTTYAAAAAIASVNFNFPSIAISSTYLYVGYEKYNDSGWGPLLAYTTTLDGSGSWTKDETAAINDGSRFRPALVATTANNAYMAYGPDGSGLNNIFGRTISSGSYGARETVSNVAANSAAFSVVSDTSGVVYVSYRKSSASTSEMMTVNRTGGSWGAAQEWGTNAQSDASSFPVLSISSGNNIKMIWVKDADFYVVENTGSGWGSVSQPWSASASVAAQALAAAGVNGADILLAYPKGTSNPWTIESNLLSFTTTLTISAIYANDQTTSLTSGLYLSYQDTTNSTGPTKYAYTGSRTFNGIPLSDVVRLKVQWTNTTATDGGVLVNGSASVDITVSSATTRTLYLSVFKSTVLAFQYSDASTSFPTASVTSVVVTSTGNTTTLTLTSFSNIGLVRNGTYTISSTNIFGVDAKSTSSFSVTADSSTKTLVAKVHQPTLNTRRNDGTAITPTNIVLVAPGNGTSLTISSYSALVMVEGAYTPSSINFYGSDVKLNATTFTPTSMSGQFTFNTIIYTRTPTFKDSAGTALYTQPTSYKVTSVNATLSSSLTPGSSAIIVGGTSTVSAITWQGTDVTPSSATFDSASGNPDFNLKVYALNVQNTLYPSTILSTAHSLTFPNSTSVEKTPSSGWINMSQVQSGTITLTATITVSSTERYRSYNTSSFTLSANTNRVHHWLHEYSASLTPKGAGGFTPNTASTALSFTLLNGTSKSLSPGSATWLLAGAGSVSSVTWQGIEVVASSTSVTIASGTDYTFNTLITKDTDSNFNFAIGGATAISFSSLASNKLSFTATAATGSHTLKLEIISPSYQVQPSKVSVDTTDYLSSTVGWVFSSTLFTVPLTFTSSPTIIVDFTQTSPGANPPSVTTTSTPSTGTSSGDTSSVTFGEPTVWQEYTQETAATTTTTTTAIGIVNVTLPVAAVNPILSLIPEPYATGLLVGLVSSAGVLIILAVKVQQYNKQFSVRMPMRERYQNRITKPRIPQRAPFLMFFGSVFGILGTLLIVGEPKFQSLFAGLFLPPQSIFNVADGLTSEAYTVAMIFGGIIVVFGVALFSTGLGFYRSLNQRLGVVRR